MKRMRAIDWADTNTSSLTDTRTNVLPYELDGNHRLSFGRRLWEIVSFFCANRTKQLFVDWGIKSLAHIDLWLATAQRQKSCKTTLWLERHLLYDDTRRSTWNTCKQHVESQTGWWEKALKPLGPALRRRLRAGEPQRCHWTVNPWTDWDRQTKRDRESMHTAVTCGLESLLSKECQLRSYIAP